MRLPVKKEGEENEDDAESSSHNEFQYFTDSETRSEESELLPLYELDRCYYYDYDNSSTDRDEPMRGSGNPTADLLKILHCLKANETAPQSITGLEKSIVSWKKRSSQAILEFLKLKPFQKELDAKPGSVVENSNNHEFQQSDQVTCDDMTKEKSRSKTDKPTNNPEEVTDDKFPQEDYEQVEGEQSRVDSKVFPCLNNTDMQKCQVTVQSNSGSGCNDLCPHFECLTSSKSNSFTSSKVVMPLNAPHASTKFNRCAVSQEISVGAFEPSLRLEKYDSERKVEYRPLQYCSNFIQWTTEGLKYIHLQSWYFSPESEKPKPPPVLAVSYFPVSLETLINRNAIPSDAVRYDLLVDIALGLKYLQISPSHANLSARKVLISTCTLQAKIADFHTDHPEETQCESTEPLAVAAVSSLDTSSDIFSFGVLMIQMFSELVSLKEQDTALVWLEYRQYLEDIGYFHPLLTRLILSCITNDSQRKGKAIDIVDQMTHVAQWFPMSPTHKQQWLSALEAHAKPLQDTHDYMYGISTSYDFNTSTSLIYQSDSEDCSSVTSCESTEQCTSSVTAPTSQVNELDIPRPTPGNYSFSASECNGFLKGDKEVSGLIDLPTNGQFQSPTCVATQANVAIRTSQDNSLDPVHQPSNCNIASEHFSLHTTVQFQLPVYSSTHTKQAKSVMLEKRAFFNIPSTNATACSTVHDKTTLSHMLHSQFVTHATSPMAAGTKLVIRIHVFPKSYTNLSDLAQKTSPVLIGESVLSEVLSKLLELVPYSGKAQHLPALCADKLHSPTLGKKDASGLIVCYSLFVPISGQHKTDAKTTTTLHLTHTCQIVPPQNPYLSQDGHFPLELVYQPNKRVCMYISVSGFFNLPTHCQRESPVSIVTEAILHLTPEIMPRFSTVPDPLLDIGEVPLIHFLVSQITPPHNQQLYVAAVSTEMTSSLSSYVKTRLTQPIPQHVQGDPFSMMSRSKRDCLSIVVSKFDLCFIHLVPVLFYESEEMKGRGQIDVWHRRSFTQPYQSRQVHPPANSQLNGSKLPTTKTTLEQELTSPSDSQSKTHSHITKCAQFLISHPVRGTKNDSSTIYRNGNTAGSSAHGHKEDEGGGGDLGGGKNSSTEERDLHNDDDGGGEYSEDGDNKAGDSDEKGGDGIDEGGGGGSSDKRNSDDSGKNDNSDEGGGDDSSDTRNSNDNGDDNSEEGGGGDSSDRRNGDDNGDDNSDEGGGGDSSDRRNSDDKGNNSSDKGGGGDSRDGDDSGNGDSEGGGDKKLYRRKKRRKKKRASESSRRGRSSPSSQQETNHCSPFMKQAVNERLNHTITRIKRLILHHHQQVYQPHQNSRCDPQHFRHTCRYKKRKKKKRSQTEENTFVSVDGIISHSRGLDDGQSGQERDTDSSQKVTDQSPPLKMQFVCTTHTVTRNNPPVQQHHQRIHRPQINNHRNLQHLGLHQYSHSMNNSCQSSALRIPQESANSIPTTSDPSSVLPLLSSPCVPTEETIEQSSNLSAAAHGNVLIQPQIAQAAFAPPDSHTLGDCPSSEFSMAQPSPNVPPSHANENGAGATCTCTCSNLQHSIPPPPNMYNHLHDNAPAITTHQRTDNSSSGEPDWNPARPIHNNNQHMVAEAPVEPPGQYIRNEEHLQDYGSGEEDLCRSNVDTRGYDVAKTEEGECLPTHSAAIVTSSGTHGYHRRWTRVQVTQPPPQINAAPPIGEPHLQAAGHGYSPQSPSLSFTDSSLPASAMCINSPIAIFVALAEHPPEPLVQLNRPQVAGHVMNRLPPANAGQPRPQPGGVPHAAVLPHPQAQEGLMMFGALEEEAVALLVEPPAAEPAVAQPPLQQNGVHVNNHHIHNPIVINAHVFQPGGNGLTAFLAMVEEDQPRELCHP